MSMVALLRGTFEIVYRLLSRRELLGAENLPASGGCLLVINHMSLVDAPMIFTLVKHPHMAAFVATKYRRSLFYRWLLNRAGVIWVRRGEADRAALQAALRALRAGKMLGVAPEGTRSRNGSLQPAKAGIAFLATNAKVPIVPTVVINTDRAFAELRRLRRPRLTLKIGPPFTLSPLTPGQRSAQLHARTEEIMLRLAALLPPRHRGVYSEHPRLAEFLDWAEAAGLRG
ncbi:MAG: lysophospholipid acyltransferase family protein [Anaerolineales bacterium]|jgi:1-acyl-sn-glycerol-3-phosphate acyltransferase|nr:lysophospholipid acyltransferase family protein [Anaerolineales bacterium]